MSESSSQGPRGRGRVLAVLILLLVLALGAAAAVYHKHVLRWWTARSAARGDAAAYERLAQQGPAAVKLLRPLGDLSRLAASNAAPVHTRDPDFEPPPWHLTNEAKHAIYLRAGAGAFLETYEVRITPDAPRRPVSDPPPELDALVINPGETVEVEARLAPPDKDAFQAPHEDASRLPAHWRLVLTLAPYDASAECDLRTEVREVWQVSEKLRSLVELEVGPPAREGRAWTARIPQTSCIMKLSSAGGGPADLSFEDLGGGALLLLWNRDQSRLWTFAVRPEDVRVRVLGMRPRAISRSASRQQVEVSGRAEFDGTATHAQVIFHANSPGRTGRPRAIHAQAWVSEVRDLAEAP